MTMQSNLNPKKESKLRSWLQIPVETEEYQAPRTGVFLLQGLVALFFLVFVVRFWYLQVHKGESYAERAQLNRMREERILAPRGLVVDSKGVILADNILTYGLSLVREDVVDLPATLAQISAWTGIDHDTLLEKFRKDKGKVQSFEPMPLVSDLDLSLVAQIEAQLLHWPGLEVISQAKRTYPMGAIYAHILGYVAEANEKEMKQNKDLAMGDLVGKQGLELVLEDQLRGRKGLYQREVDVMGRSLSKKLLTEPRSGSSTRLAIDTRIQQAAWAALDGYTGSIVVMDPDTGKLVALVTAPAYDNNLFTSGISHKDWNALRENPRFPLQNRVIQSVYPPASVWKLIMTGLFLEQGVDPKEKEFCGGEVKLGNRVFRCWHPGHGSVDMTRALTESCDIYYYLKGERMGIDNIERYAKASGFGKPTGIILPHEKGGLVPSKAWKKERIGVPWVRGDTYNISIGQGFGLVTPLQVATYISALLNGGKLLQPQVLDVAEPVIKGEIPATALHREFILTAMRKTADTGTAKVVGRKDADMGGKTGTAQVVKLKLDGKRRLKNDEIEYLQRDHAWIATFGMKDAQRYVVVVMLEHGGGGSSAAGPVAKKMYDVLFGVEVPPEQKAKPTTLPRAQDAYDAALQGQGLMMGDAHGAL